jgi:hypothetical protein
MADQLFDRWFDRPEVGCYLRSSSPRTCGGYAIWQRKLVESNKVRNRIFASGVFRYAQDERQIGGSEFPYVTTKTLIMACPKQLQDTVAEHHLPAIQHIVDAAKGAAVSPERVRQNFKLCDHDSVRVHPRHHDPTSIGSA